MKSKSALSLSRTVEYTFLDITDTYSVKVMLKMSKLVLLTCTPSEQHKWFRNVLNQT